MYVTRPCVRISKDAYRHDCSLKTIVSENRNSDLACTMSCLTGLFWCYRFVGSGIWFSLFYNVVFIAWIVDVYNPFYGGFLALSVVIGLCIFFAILSVL